MTLKAMREQKTINDRQQPTPETDAATFRGQKNGEPVYCVLKTVAMRLERERDRLRAQVEELGGFIHELQERD